MSTSTRLDPAELEDCSDDPCDFWSPELVESAYGMNDALAAFGPKSCAGGDMTIPALLPTPVNSPTPVRLLVIMP